MQCIKAMVFMTAIIYLVPLPALSMPSIGLSAQMVERDLRPVQPIQRIDLSQARQALANLLIYPQTQYG
jgi:hypothetical protein